MVLRPWHLAVTSLLIAAGLGASWIGSSATGIAVQSPSIPDFSVLNCPATSRVSSSPLYDPNFVNPMTATETIDDFANTGSFGMDISGLNVDQTRLGATGGDIHIRNNEGAVIMVVAMNKEGNYGWRVAEWVRCG